MEWTPGVGAPTFKSLRRKELQRSRSFPFSVGSLADQAHRNLTEFLGDLVVRDGLADHDSPSLP